MISFAPAGYHQYKGAIDKNGKLDAWQEHFITFTADGKKEVSGGGLTENLKFSTIAPNLRRATTMMPLMIPTGPWRAPGDNAQVFAQQGFMHEMSTAAGRDHVAFLIDAVNRGVPGTEAQGREGQFQSRTRHRGDQALRREGGMGQEAAARPGVGPCLVLFPCRACGASGRTQRRCA